MGSRSYHGGGILDDLVLTIFLGPRLIRGQYNSKGDVDNNNSFKCNFDDVGLYLEVGHILT
jgi:hypothetical protein